MVGGDARQFDRVITGLKGDNAGDRLPNFLQPFAGGIDNHLTVNLDLHAGIGRRMEGKCASGRECPFAQKTIGFGGA